MIAGDGYRTLALAMGAVHRCVRSHGNRKQSEGVPAPDGFLSQTKVSHYMSHPTG